MIVFVCVFFLWLMGKTINNYAGIALKDHHAFSRNIDIHLVKKLQKLWHGSDAFVIILLTIYIVHLKFGFTFTSWSEIKILLIIWSIWWIIFDPSINYLRKHALLRVGTTAQLDKTVRWLSKKIGVPETLFGLIFKITLLIIFILL